MKEHETTEASQGIAASEASESTAKTHGFKSKIEAKRKMKEEQARIYQEQLSAAIAENTDYLTALAAYAGEKVPSSADVIQKIVAMYSASANTQATKR